MIYLISRIGATYSQGLTFAIHTQTIQEFFSPEALRENGSEASDKQPFFKSRIKRAEETEKAQGTEKPPEEEGDDSTPRKQGRGGGRDWRRVIPKAVKKENKNTFVKWLAIGGGVSLLIIVLVIIIVIILVLKERKRRRLLEAQKPHKEKAPRKMEAAEIGNTKFKERGALVLASSLEGPVVHALEEDADAQTLPTLQFDPALNEIVDIGSQIEVMDGGKEEKEKDDNTNTARPQPLKSVRPNLKQQAAEHRKRKTAQKSIFGQLKSKHKAPHQARARQSKYNRKSKPRTPGSTANSKPSSRPTSKEGSRPTSKEGSREKVEGSAEKRGK
ncbi:hypothetical protein Q1695_013346 [Nippostrongylus brasiliensis]|nr:hypothetical protein Q1695_013346 [Nippostrongylus brasiliensis]